MVEIRNGILFDFYSGVPHILSLCSFNVSRFIDSTYVVHTHTHSLTHTHTHTAPLLLPIGCLLFKRARRHEVSAGLDNM